MFRKCIQKSIKKVPALYEDDLQKKNQVKVWGKAMVYRRQFYMDNKMVTIYPGASQGSPIVYLNTFAEEGGQIYRALQERNCPDLTLVAISGMDWNRDMSPWENPPVFKGDASFAGGAEEYLHFLEERIAPEVEKMVQGGVSWRGLAGYSLAGLFAVYSAYQTKFFSRIACASGSLWFPGFKEYVFSHEMPAKPERCYFSLGDRECHTKNPCMKTVQDDTEAIEAFYREKGMKTILQMNPGGHFKDAAERMARGILWIAKEG